MKEIKLTKGKVASKIVRSEILKKANEILQKGKEYQWTPNKNKK